MDITQLMASGGMVSAIGGLMYWLNNKRLDRLENDKASREVCEIKHENIKEDFKEIHVRLERGNVMLSDIQQSIVRMETLINDKSKP